MSTCIESNGCKYDTQGKYDCPKVVEGFSNCSSCPDGCKCDGERCKKYFGEEGRGMWGPDCYKECSCSDESSTIEGDLSDLMAERKRFENEEVEGKWDDDDTNDEVTFDDMEDTYDVSLELKDRITGNVMDDPEINGNFMDDQDLDEELRDEELRDEDLISDINNEIEDLKSQIEALRNEKRAIRR